MEDIPAPSMSGGSGTALNQPPQEQTGAPISLPPPASITNAKQQSSRRYPKSLTALDIICTDFHRPEIVIPGILHEGLTVLAGKPKVGKSELSRSLGYAVATGIKALGEIEVIQGEVLYLALEDTAGRLKDRLEKSMFGVPPSNLHFNFEWPCLENKGIENLENWLHDHPQTKLVIVDTLARIRGAKGSKGSYAADYETISSLKKTADKYKISLVIIHHLRKSEAADRLDLVSGSTGITAAADYIAILTRERTGANAMLYITGRGIEENELALKFNRNIGTFELLGQGEEYRLSAERREILDFLKSTEGPVKLKQISQTTGKKEPVLCKHLSALVKIGVIEQPNYGQYQYIHRKEETRKSSESGKSDETPAKNEY